MFGPGCMGPEVDYRKLLMKYIEYVALLEGTDFLGGHHVGIGFTEEEWKELIAVSEEAYADHNEDQRILDEARVVASNLPIGEIE